MSGADKESIAAGIIEHELTGWARRSMEGPEDVRDVIELFQINHERAASKYRDVPQEKTVRG